MPWATYTCAYCSADNNADVDISAGRRQEYVEDCQACCRPNLLSIEIDTDGEVILNAQPENG